MTRSSLLLLAACAILSTCVAAGQRPRRPQPPPSSKPHAPTPYLITGTVLSSIDQGRVPHCHLTVAPVVRTSFANRQFSADRDAYDCDEHGHFSIPIASVGLWRLSASAPGFVTQAYDEHQGFFSDIVLTVAKPTINLQFFISPEAAITGVIFDEAGEPVRNAQVFLHTVPPIGPGGAQPHGAVQSNTRTDDRGVYELPNISPGAYRISVQAQPWYTAAAQPNRSGSSDSSAIDPSLDFAYPITWFPGADDPALAETITLHAGDIRQADFHLTPIPSLHLRILPPPGVPATNGRTIPFTPTVQQIVPGGGNQTFVPVSIHTDSQGQVDVGGLAPGQYQVRVPSSNQPGASRIVQVTAGAAQTLDLSSPSDDAKLTLHFDGPADSGSESHPIQVAFINADTGISTFPSNNGEGGPSGGFRRRESRDSTAERIVELPPGRYEVVLQSSLNLYLTGLTAKGAEAAGRYVIVPSGASTLTLHIANGKATLTGIATFQDKPSSGAMVLLVPTTIEDPNSFKILRRDQTNTDGSFDLSDIIPGQYILVVLDHGWQINWSDPSTLRHYLTQGIPIDLSAGANVKQDINAQAP